MVKKTRRSGGMYSDIKTRTTNLSKRIGKYLRSLKSGGGRLESWQDKYPFVGTSGWSPENNICKYPDLSRKAFGTGGARKRRTRRSRRLRKSRSKKRGGEYSIPETYFGRKPINFSYPKISPYPSLKSWSGKELR